MQDNLNSVWNFLADAVETNRDRIYDDADYFELYADCKFTSEWIVEKAVQLTSSIDSDADSLDAVLQLRRRLTHLEGDMTVIAARVEHITSRVTVLLEKLEHQESTETELSSARDLSMKDRLRQQHRRMLEKWTTLKETVEQHAAKLTTGGHTQRFLDNLEKFEMWLNDMKLHLACDELPHDMQVCVCKNACRKVLLC